MAAVDCPPDLPRRQADAPWRRAAPAAQRSGLGHMHVSHEYRRFALSPTCWETPRKSATWWLEFVRIPINSETPPRLVCRASAPALVRPWGLFRTCSETPRKSATWWLEFVRIPTCSETPPRPVRRAQARTGCIARMGYAKHTGCRARTGCMTRIGWAQPTGCRARTGCIARMGYAKHTGCLARTGCADRTWHPDRRRAHDPSTQHCEAALRWTAPERRPGSVGLPATRTRVPQCHLRLPRS